MNRTQIEALISRWEARKQRTIVIVDYGNVEKWKHGLKWRVGIRELAALVKHFSSGTRELRRFYYGADYGPDEKATELVEWSRMALDKAEGNYFEVVAKRVKYIRDHQDGGNQVYQKKCDLDVDMAIDLVKMRDKYDHIILFSGDGDIVCAVRYMIEEYGKTCVTFGARDHIGREVFDAKKDGLYEDVCYAEDFEYRLRDRYFR
jgi:uncharacterized LabA/DUF88 family protein